MLPLQIFFYPCGSVYRSFQHVKIENDQSGRLEITATACMTRASLLLHKPGRFCACTHGDPKWTIVASQGHSQLSTTSWQDALMCRVLPHSFPALACTAAGGSVVGWSQLLIAISALPHTGLCHLLVVDSMRKDQVKSCNNCKTLPFGNVNVSVPDLMN